MSVRSSGAPRYYPVTGGGALPEEALVFTDAAAFGDFLAEYGGPFRRGLCGVAGQLPPSLPGGELHLQDWFFDAGGELVVVALPALPEGSRCAVTDAWTDTDNPSDADRGSAAFLRPRGSRSGPSSSSGRRRRSAGWVLDRETVRAPSYGPAAEALLAALGDGREWYPRDPTTRWRRILRFPRTGEGLLAVNGYGVVTAVREEAPGCLCGGGVLSPSGPAGHHRAGGPAGGRQLYPHHRHHPGRRQPAGRQHRPGPAPVRRLSAGRVKKSPSCDGLFRVFWAVCYRARIFFASARAAATAASML